MESKFKIEQAKPQPGKRVLILISGYYGYENLGDEAILEELLFELRQLNSALPIVVLSNNPTQTKSIHNVSAIPRFNLWQFCLHLPHTKLFISGGGGLFQDTHSLGSIIFYGLQILLARLCGAKVLIYAQGIGPLRRELAKILTKGFWKLADFITVRDNASYQQLQDWGIKAELTADPVWSLKESPLPVICQRQFDYLCSTNKEQQLVVGLSLRPSMELRPDHLELLAKLCTKLLPPSTHFCLLPLQKEIDLPLLMQFQEVARPYHLSSQILAVDETIQPSIWLAIMRRLDLLIGMRLHALLMAIKAGKPVIGIAYDPKVKYLLNEFQQPLLALNMAKIPTEEDWSRILENTAKDMNRIRNAAANQLEQVKIRSCKNKEILAKILSL